MDKTQSDERSKTHLRLMKTTITYGHAVDGLGGFPIAYVFSAVGSLHQAYHVTREMLANLEDVETIHIPRSKTATTEKPYFFQIVLTEQQGLALGISGITFSREIDIPT